MNWQEMQEKVLKNLNPDQLDWLLEKEHIETKIGDIRKMTLAEIKKLFPEKKDSSKINDSKLIMNFIWQSYLMIKSRELKPLKGNLRSFWYRELRPFYKNNGLLEKDEGPEIEIIGFDFDEFEEEKAKSLLNTLGEGSGRELYIINRMSKCFDEFVIKAIFKFREEFEFQDPRESFSIIGHDKPRIIFFTEKEGLFWLCQEISKKYGISAVASQGEPGYLTMEYFADKLNKRNAKSIEIASLTDYDPWGYNIANEFAQKMAEPIFEFKKVNSKNLTNLDLFTKEVIEYAKRDLSKVSPTKKKQVDDWMKITNGIDGKAFGMHVDHAEIDLIWKAVDKWYNGL